MKPESRKSYAVGGRVTEADGTPSPGVFVRAFDRDPRGREHPLGAVASTDPQGRYKIEFSSRDLPPGRERQGGPDVCIRVFAEGGTPASTELGESAVKRPVDGRIDLDISIARPVRSYVVTGRTAEAHDKPCQGLFVRAFDRDPEGPEHPLGSSGTTDADGRYRIEFTSRDVPPGREERGGPDVLVRAFRDAGVPPGKELGESPVKRPVDGQVALDLSVKCASDEPNGKPLTVHGTVRDQNGEPLDKGTVQALDRDLRSEQLLGSDKTHRGRYKIRYKREAFRRAEKDLADLVVKVLGDDGHELHRTPIHYNAPDGLELNIDLRGVPYRGPSEWQAMTDEILPLLEDVAPQDLKENEQFQDVSFLAGETGRERLMIGTWIACYRLSQKCEREQTPLEPAVFFAFLRQGQPSIFYDTLLQDMQDPDRVALLEDKILRGLAELPPDLQRSLLEKAVADDLIPPRFEAQIEQILETLARIKLRYAADASFGGGKGTIGELLELNPIDEPQREAFLAALTSHNDRLDTFWKKLEDDEIIDPELVPQVRLSFEVGALTRNHIPLVGELVDQFKSGDLTGTRELAKYDRVQWKAVFDRKRPNGEPIGVPAGIDGDTEEERREQFAAILDQQFERAYPTASFAAKLGRSQQPAVASESEVVPFLDNNPGFHLDRFRIDHYIDEHEDALNGIEDPEALVADLKSVQRAFKLRPTYQAVDALLSRNIDSAQQIYFMGRGQFVNAVTSPNGQTAVATVRRGTAAEMTETPSTVNTIEARQIYQRAENTYALALALYGEYNVTVNSTAPFAVPDLLPDAETQAKIAALPNLQALFGSLDYCECTHCRSVYSPAAYFVDVMRFLGQRGTHGSEINAGKTVRDVLIARRPDLGEIELSCENTNTPLPYIDLVNEVLEDVVAPPAGVTLDAAIEPDLVEGPIAASVRSELTGKGIAIGPDAHVYGADSRAQWAVRDPQHAYRVFKDDGGVLRLLPTRQTFLSAAELRANPEYTNDAAYSKLRQEVFPLDLPFDLWNLQARTYLDHLGVAQPRLLELFQQKLTDGVTLAPTDLQIACARLGITETERKILTGTLPAKQPWDFWGLVETGNNIPHPNAPSDPTRNVTGTWIDVLGNVDVLLHRGALSYTDLLQLLDTRYVNPTGVVDILDTSEANAASCDTSKFRIRNLSADTLNRIHRFVRLWRKLDCPMWELDLLLPDIDASLTVTDKRITDAALQDIAGMTRLGGETDLDRRVVLSLYRGIDHEAYVDRSREGAPAVQTLYQRLFRNKLVDAVANFPSSPDQVTGTIADRVPGILAAFRIKEADLNLVLADLGFTPTGSLDASVLSRIHRIAVLAPALDLTVDAFLSLKRLWAQDPFATPQATQAFVDLARRVSASEFSVAELDYLLAHRFTPTSGVALEDKAIVAVLQALRDGLQRISDDVRLKTAESKADYVKARLGVLPTLADDADQAVALAIIDGTWQGTAAERDAFIDAFFADVLDTAVAKVKLAALPGGLSPADRDVEVAKRFDYVQPELEEFLLRTQAEALIRETVATALGLDVPSAAALLDGLDLPGSSSSLLESVHDPRLLHRLPDDSYQLPLDETSFPAIFKSLRLLHKIAMVVVKLELRADAVEWWLAGSHAADMGWMHPGAFPLDTTTPQLDIGRWVAMQRFFAWASELPASELTPVEFADRVLDGTRSSPANIADLAEVTGWPAADIDTLAAAFRWLATGVDTVKQELRSSANLERLADCIRALRRLGVNAARAIQWAKAEPTSADADSLKQTVKSKYDLAQWQQVIQPIQDGFRELRRRALVGWLIAHPDPIAGQSWTDADDLYSYFLIDVEMSPCMLTSRLKQAAGSAQLFVQRCLLNLEVDILAKTDLDPKWKQWKWMKRYRVWEANRKVFLYPENWIEPELRDEKSPFFEELESELLQNDVTNETAEQAYLNYLEKLDAVANLEIRAMYDQVISQNESVLHVFGRTRSSQAPEHYHRTRINGGRWTAWKKLDLEIKANHLLPGVHNRRLYLLWPQFLEKADEPSYVSTPSANSSTRVAQPNRYWEIRLFWSELRKGKWAPATLSDSYAQMYQWAAGGNRPENVTLRTRLAPYIQARVFRSSDPTARAPYAETQFDKIGKQLTTVPAPVYEHLISPAQSQYHNGLIRHNSASQYFYYGAVEERWKPHELSAHEGASAIRVLRAVRPRETYSVIDAQAKGFANNGSFFVWDRARSYFVDYSWRTDWSYFSYAWHATVVSSFRFFIHYHPFVELFTKELNIWGVKGLLNRRIQLEPESIPGAPARFNFADYQPEDVVQNPRPVEDVDFSYLGAYAPYNWELFFHVPLFIANRLSYNQRFEEALEWFHYIFDPTSTDTAVANPDTPQQKFWITKPFYQTTRADYYKQKIENIMLAIAKGDLEAREQVKEWRDYPFNPHLIARMRTVAYQKNVLIKYIQTLIAWADQLFRQDTIESINEATQLYILAASVLGPRPKSVPKNVPNPVKTFYQLQKDGIDDFGNALKEVENLVSTAPASSTMDGDAPELPHLNVLYFCIPNNEKLLALWDTVGDRLFKIRYCMNIEGVVRQLALFEPPIDPGMLVRASAAGVDVGAALSDMSAPLPPYRFRVQLERALVLCQEVKTLGAAMLSALEKRDAEAFALLRSAHERVMLDQVRLVKEEQVTEALRGKEALEESRKVIEERKAYYERLIRDGLSIGEIASLAMTGGAIAAEIAATVFSGVGAALSLIPQLDAGAAGFGGSPTVTFSIGGQSFTLSLNGAAAVSKGIGATLQLGSGMSATIASHQRRHAEWEFQRALAEKELPQVDKQIAASDVRHGIAEQELKNQDKQIDHAREEQDHLRTKFTNRELYDWMVGQLSTVYFQSYQLAYDVAKRAERCFRYELGLSDSNYVQFGHWDSLKKGLLAGEKLFFDLKRLEAAYHERNRREYELTKHISLSQLDPAALLKLRRNGECFVELPETAFDMDYPGHYFRRIKSIRLSIPCTTGPYTTVGCTMTLTSNRLRVDSTLLGGKYERDTTIDDPRFRDEIAGIQSIATSGAQNDSGMFQLDFQDDRYLPFEGAGAISSWHVKLNKDLPQFDFSTIADVIVHVDYTAREGGELLRSKAVDEIDKKLNALALAESRRGLYHVLDLKREYADKWQRFLFPASPADDQALVLDDLPLRLPYFTRRFANKKAWRVEVVAKMKDGALYKVMLSPLGTTSADLLPLSPDATYQGMHRAFKDLTGSEVALGDWTLKVQRDGAADFKSLPTDAVKELFLVVGYKVA